VTTTFEERLELLEGALASAREAARTVLEGWRTRPAVEFKGAVDLVTEYDRRSERLLRERLSARSGLPIVGEEEGVGQGAGSASEGACWYVDPIDGTTNFVHGHPYFCVSVGLVIDGTPIAGAVVAPALQMEWTGVVEGAFDTRPARDARRVALRNGQPCVVSSVERLDRALLATGFPYDVHTSTDNNLDAFVKLIRRAQAIRRCGSAAMDLCHVAEGTYDGYWERKLKTWDIAAGCAIVAAAGGTLSSYEGRPIDVRAQVVLATNGYIHEALVQELPQAT
jgi:myo-inositol-1(or 4)-monophosphatase